MRVFCLYRPNTDHERAVIEFNSELKRRYNVEVEVVSMDTIDGANLAKTYDIMQYPAVAVVDSRGSLHHLWGNGELPLLNEVSYYLQQS